MIYVYVYVEVLISILHTLSEEVVYREDQARSCRKMNGKELLKAFKDDTPHGYNPRFLSSSV